MGLFDFFKKKKEEKPEFKIEENSDNKEIEQDEKLEDR